MPFSLFNREFPAYAREFPFYFIKIPFPMSTTDAKVITLVYELRKDHATGEIIETVDPTKPAEFLFGTGHLIRGFEHQVKDLQKDDTFEFTINPEEAYGAIDQGALVELPKDIFMIEGRLAEELLVMGNMINMQDQNGNPLRGKVTGITENSVSMDFNHPLAGVTLHFSGRVLASRPATAEEVSHGHVHTGHDGH